MIMISQTCDFSIFLQNSNLGRNFNSVIKRVKLRHHAKFCGDGSKRCRDMGIFQFFSKMAPATIWIFGISKDKTQQLVS